ncbi:adenylyl-sulfate kinase [Burkholderia latens]|uniref:Adenylyl-sulfate kinase n=1 Tax=Burkholderia latens TaxID=488446 RepID=A0A6H9TIF2_9BURK|nr:adenylyl-sulfate kinase [Burkholderia latens]KAB0644834.1 adenylyl-sulfate kinase [Burkholderia latens]
MSTTNLHVNPNNSHECNAIPPVLWLTGLSGAGKSTIARALCASLKANGKRTVTLDGDELRAGICSDLGFSVADRDENIRRIAHIAKLFNNEHYVTIVATISPLASQRTLARSIIGAGFIEVYVCTPLQECIRRDPKGLYARASRGEVRDFSGISSAYECPLHPDVMLDTSGITVESAVASILPLIDFLAPNVAFDGSKETPDRRSPVTTSPRDRRTST